MSRFVALAFILVIAVGCWRNAPPVVVAPPEPPVAVVDPNEPREAPEDGSIPPPRPAKARTRAESLALGVEYLLAQQSKDGAWHSDVYATFKDGTALTPLAVTALQEARDAGVQNPKLDAAIKTGCEFLATFSKEDGTIAPPADGFDYPIYTASLTLKAFSHPTAKDFAKHRPAWVKYIKERQLTKALGWKEEDKQYGGWGYCRVIPKKPEPNMIAPPLIESNLSATLFAVDALKAAGEADAELYEATAVFVRRCQNFRPPLRVDIPGHELLDNGFHFIYDDPTRNKAGRLAANETIFNSYGSSTADGLHALHLCNPEGDKDRQDRAGEWLTYHFRANHHPGKYAKVQESNRDAVYYYYVASVARAFRDHKLALPNGRDWSAELSYELVIRQAKDGSWTNPVELVRENDPLVATSNAVLALARCK